MWQSIDGYVIIQIKGTDAERLLNEMQAAGIWVRGIRRLDRTTLHCRIRAGDFKRLHRLRRRSRCKIHILSRSGLPFALVRLWRRKALCIGLTLVFLGLMFLSTRICVIRVTGCERLAEQTVLRALESLGVTVGRPRSGLSLPALGTELLAADERIGWAEVTLDGVILTVKIVETVTAPEPIDPEVPCEVVAVKDGVILRVNALAGTPAVRAGDAVQAGDVLIHGDLTREDSQLPLRVHAYGEVLANVYYFSEAAVLAETTRLQPSGRTAPYRAIYVGGRLFYESECPFADFERSDTACAALSGTVLPLRAVSGLYRELTEQPVALSESEMKEQAAFEAEQNAYLRIPKDAVIVEKTIRYTEYNGCLIAVVCIVTEETIGIQKELVYDGNE